MEPQLSWYLALSAILFTIGVVGVIIKRNVIAMFMCIELMLNAVNLTFVAFSSYFQDVTGQLFVFIVMTVAAAEAAVGLGIIIALFRNRDGLKQVTQLCHPSGGRLRAGRGAGKWEPRLGTKPEPQASLSLPRRPQRLQRKAGRCTSRTTRRSGLSSV